MFQGASGPPSEAVTILGGGFFHMERRLAPQSSQCHCIKTHEVRTLFRKTCATLELMIRDLGFYGANAFYNLSLAQRVRTSCVFMRRGLPRGGIWRFRRMRRAPVTAFQQPEITGA